MQIKAKELKSGDFFIFNNQEQVAIDTVLDDCLWVTNRDYYLTKDRIKSGFVYGYTNAGVISISAEDVVELIENIEQ